MIRSPLSSSSSVWLGSLSCSPSNLCPDPLQLCCPLDVAQCLHVFFVPPAFVSLSTEKYPLGHLKHYLRAGDGVKLSCFKVTFHIMQLGLPWSWLCEPHGGNGQAGVVACLHQHEEVERGWRACFALSACKLSLCFWVVTSGVWGANSKSGPQGKWDTCGVQLLAIAWLFSLSHISACQAQKNGI